MIARASQLFLPTLRDAPADAEALSHKLMLRAGLIRQVGAGMWTFLPAGYRVLKRVEAIIGSMTPQERRNYQILNASRRKRIAKGSGTSVAEVNRLIKQFAQTKKMLKQIGSGPMPRLPGGFPGLPR